MRVRRAFTYRFGHGGTIDVPAGARLLTNHWDGGYWVDPSTYPAGSIERHDASHYGVRVGIDNAKEPG